MAAPENGHTGAQAVGRACIILREVARHGSAGARMIDLTAGLGLPRPTVHRILQPLIAETLIAQDPKTRRYRLGTGIFELGLVAPSPLDRLAKLRPLLDDLAAKTGDTAYLMMRRGDEVICLARAEGASPIRTYVFEVGVMRPLGASLAGICMMAALPDAEINKIIKRSVGAFARFGQSTPEYIRKQISEVRQRGYAYSSEVLLKSATGLSATIPNPGGLPYLSISLSAVTARVPQRRVEGLAADLLNACKEMSKLLLED